ncbi:hypothetical protein MTsPCn9_12970 [Croceitalea sp. MTPC9]|uniref:hypothetical protein n=1 Tax=unclassified Croceitalea TaxID=2632280 RepID=UPI002B38B31D|nr:hypothetical protein MTsPCn6_16160 [Croceitalea sp. MTPC6]GMN16361.1 hypothetical protein MTsPCn9_12970 [Croceitalea sp. MTPC9]
MKNIVILFVVSFITLTTITAQKVIEKNFSYKEQFIELDVNFARNIEVKTWDKNTVYFKADIYTEDPQFLDFYKLNLNEGAGKIDIEEEAEGVFKAYRKDCIQKNPNKKRNCYNTGDLVEFNYVLYVPKNAKFKVSSINGDLKSDVIEGNFMVDLINGNIDIKKYSGNLDLSTINGEIDLKISNTSLLAETIHGDIYASEELGLISEDKHVGQKIWSESSSAKNKLKLNTINGNMYLR